VNWILSSCLAASLIAGLAAAEEGGRAKSGATAQAKWTNGPPSDPAYFPIAVWLQDPRQASRYKEAGINLYVGLWQGPTDAQLAALKAAGMPVVCDQNAVGLRHRDDPTIVAWMHGDEPDNAQSLGKGKGYGPPILPATIVADYQRIRAADPTRPVLLNLGQAVAWDKWHGRGVRTNHPEDYPEYAKGGDIVSFDIYPVVHSHADVRGNLWYVARGVERLRKWAGDAKPVWNCIECTRIGSDTKPTPHQLKAEIWMSLIHGSKGIIYFVHEWKPKFNEHALLDDPEMLEAATAINKQIRELAPVLNSPDPPAAAKVASSNKDVPVALMHKVHAGSAYLFAVALRDGAAKASFEVGGIPPSATAHVLGEARQLPVRDGRFEDDFQGYQVHLYQIK